ncbi:hypothetical protein D3C73_798680 [compost metagenome]
MISPQGEPCQAATRMRYPIWRGECGGVLQWHSTCVRRASEHKITSGIKTHARIPWDQYQTTRGRAGSGGERVETARLAQVLIAHSRAILQSHCTRR